MKLLDHFGDLSWTFPVVCDNKVFYFLFMSFYLGVNISIALERQLNGETFLVFGFLSVKGSPKNELFLDHKPSSHI
jgi:hypothetical protein